MTLFTIMPLAFVIGMGHALETDHLAAVSNMLAKKGGRRALMARGRLLGPGSYAGAFCAVLGGGGVGAYEQWAGSGGAGICSRRHDRLFGCPNIVANVS